MHAAKGGLGGPGPSTLIKSLSLIKSTKHSDKGVKKIVHSICELIILWRYRFCIYVDRYNSVLQLRPILIIFYAI